MRVSVVVLAASLVASSTFALIACGARSDPLGDDTPFALPDSSLLDHKADARKPPPDSTPLDAPYVTKGIKCVRDGGAPPVFMGDLDASFDANHPRAPQVVTLGGPTLSMPVFISITFPGDDMRDQVEDFVDSVGCTDYWRAVASDYGVGQGVGGPHTRLPESAPTSIDDAQIQQWLASKIKSEPNFPQPDANTLYVIFYPAGTTITLQGEQSCQRFGGYHNSAAVGAKDVPYAVIPRCESFGNLSGIDAVTGTTSHELIEAVTDPAPEQKPAYAIPENDGIGFAIAAGGEVGDMCEFKSDAFFQPSSYPFTVQRSWANKAGFALADPCQPSLPGAYFSAAAKLTQFVSFDIGFGPQQARGVKLPLGQQTSIDIAAFANGSVPSWTITTYDSAQLRGQPPELGLSLSKTVVSDGDIVHLAITRKKASPFGVSAFGIVSSDGSRQAFSWHLVGD